MIAVRFDPTFSAWRDKARELLSAEVTPDRILWCGGEQTGLFDDPLPPPRAPAKVPRDFLTAAETVACHRDPRKWTLLYRVLYRLTHGEPWLLQVSIDDDVRELLSMQKQIGRDIHQMHAFVRFRKVDEHYVAWYQPDHFIVDTVGPFFAKRFASMHWSILTPDRSVTWDTQQLLYGPGVPRSQAPGSDDLEELWRTYYKSTFNPARVNLDQLRVHMPERRWSTMPETQAISELVRSSPVRQQRMIEARHLSAAPFLPEQATLPVLSSAVHACRGCDLWEHATQPVFGEGPADARIAFVGEQPGDSEDREGRPFVGSAGQLFDQALAEAGLQRGEVYLTNAVKHFRYEERGKRRIHKTASKAQVTACQPWLERELQLVRPDVIVCMGNTAALSVIGRGVRVMEERGQIVPHRYAAGVTVTVHPAFLLRMPDESRRQMEYQRFVDDIRAARVFAEAQRTPPLPNLLERASLEKCS